MTNPTRQEIIEAYDDLARLAGIAIRLAIKSEGQNSQKLDEIDDLHRAIFKALQPKPAPTMAEIEWEDNKHYLAEAEHPYFGKVIMLGKAALSGRVRITCDKENSPLKSHTLWQAVEPETLTPTGKRYTLTEVQE